jgi:hypothetical protein
MASYGEIDVGKRVAASRQRQRYGRVNALYTLLATRATLIIASVIVVVLASHVYCILNKLRGGL